MVRRGIAEARLLSVSGVADYGDSYSIFSFCILRSSDKFGSKSFVTYRYYQRVLTIAFMRALELRFSGRTPR